MIYIKIERCTQSTKREMFLKDVASVYCEDSALMEKVKNIKLYRFKEGEKDTCVMSAMAVIEKIGQVAPQEDVENLGESDFIMKHIPYKEEKSVWVVLKILFVTMICFFGAGFTIMAFHNDIDIRSVFESIYFLFTGEENDGFTILEVAYCIGLASGIILFFNHVGKRKITSDPTPIEVEMKTYEDDVEKTLVENAEREGLKIDCGS